MGQPPRQWCRILAAGAALGWFHIAHDLVNVLAAAAPGDLMATVAQNG